jgi:hypothetical protein
MANLGVPNANEARAVDARQEIDLKVGNSRPNTLICILTCNPKYGFAAGSMLTLRQTCWLQLHKVSNPVFSRSLQWIEFRFGILWPLSGFYSLTPAQHDFSMHCQTPTLGFCVARADEITRFVPEP